MSLLSALCEDGALANLLVEGSVDQSVFEHFVYHTLKKLSNSTNVSSDRPVVVFLDNATIHKTPLVQNTLKKMGVLTLYGCQYTP